MTSSTRRHALMSLAAGGALFLAARPAAAQAVAGARNVMETMAADGRFNRFIELIGRAGGTDQLRSSAGVTIFAPLDAGFDAANARVTELLQQGSGGNISSQSADPIRLRALVEYHIVAGRYPIASLIGDRRLKTVNGAEIRVANEGGRIAVANPAPERQQGSFGAGGLNIPPPAMVVGPELVANNGLILPLSQVLFP